MFHYLSCNYFFQISYSLLEDRSGDHKYFSIDPELGLIYTQSVFDRETKSSYLLEVQSVDSWESARPGRHGQANSGKHVLAWCFSVPIPCCFFSEAGDMYMNFCQWCGIQPMLLKTRYKLFKY